jgi:hypothetical protein
MTALTNNSENLLLNFLFRNVTNSPIAAPTAWYVALHSGDPGETGATAELANANGYARQQVTFSVPSSGSCNNAGTTSANGAALTFTSSGSAWGTVSHISVWDSGSYGAGNALIKGSLSSPVAMGNAGDQLQISATQLVLSLD